MAALADSTGARPTVLVVDDEPAVCQALKDALRTIDAEVLTTGSGPEALASLNEVVVDLIIADARMPEMSGIELLDQVGEKFPQVRRLLLVDESRLRETISGIRSGSVSRYVAKPWDDNHLRSVVDHAVTTARLRRDNQRLNEMTAAQNQELQALSSKLETNIAERTSELAQAAEELERRNGELDRHRQMLEKACDDLLKSHETMVALLANVIELRDPESSDTGLKSMLSNAMGEAMELDEEALMDLRHATILHRIGRMALADGILHQPSRTLSRADWKEYRKHPVYAESLLMGVPRLQKAANIMRAQHELYDGHGYPDGKAGDGIPLESRILAVARDYYDLIAGRLDAQKFTPAQALQYIQDNADRRYDARIVKCLIKVLPTILEEDPFLEEVAIAARLLVPGMRLARDLVTPDGVLMLHKKHELNENIIAKIINLEEAVGEGLQIFVMRESLEAAE